MIILKIIILTLNFFVLFASDNIITKIDLVQKYLKQHCKEGMKLTIVKIDCGKLGCQFVKHQYIIDKTHSYLTLYLTIKKQSARVV